MADQKKTRVLVLGVTGMLGSTLFRAFSHDPALETYGTMRDTAGARHFPKSLHGNLIPNIMLEAENGPLTVFERARPDIVINCVGIIKQLSNAKDYVESLTINAALPHRLAKYCSLIGARLVHFSTDCVFSGAKGAYTEADFPDADDLYGRTKLLGEVDYQNTITLRTSIIGHELSSNKSLADWFLSQSGTVNGYRRAIFSGLPTIEVAKVLRDFVLPNTHLHGIYHLSADPINKYDLLSLVANAYGKDITILPDEAVAIDRSLDSSRFQTATGFSPRPWTDLVASMHADHTALASQE